MTSAINGAGGPNGPSVTRPSASNRPQEGDAVLSQSVALRPGKVSGSQPLSPGIARNLPAPLVKSEMRGLVKDLAAQSPVDAAKVERLSQQVNAGSYKVDAAKLADAMIASLTPEKLR